VTNCLDLDSQIHSAALPVYEQESCVLLVRIADSKSEVLRTGLWFTSWITSPRFKPESAALLAGSTLLTTTPVAVAGKP
jgi:hypothetical protein